MVGRENLKSYSFLERHSGGCDVELGKEYVADASQWY
jgi:hypothetical protein